MPEEELKDGDIVVYWQGRRVLKRLGRFVEVDGVKSESCECDDGGIYDVPLELLD